MYFILIQSSSFLLFSLSPQPKEISSTSLKGGFVRVWVFTLFYGFQTLSLIMYCVILCLFGFYFPIFHWKTKVQSSQRCLQLNWASSLSMILSHMKIPIFQSQHVYYLVFQLGTMSLLSRWGTWERKIVIQDSTIVDKHAHILGHFNTQCQGSDLLPI